MFKKNAALTGFAIGKFIKTADGSEVTTGTPVCKRMLDGTGGSLTNAAYYDSVSGLWKINLTAADMNGDLVGLAFTLTNCQPIAYTIKTTANTVDDLYTLIGQANGNGLFGFCSSIATGINNLGYAVDTLSDNSDGILYAVQNIQNNTFIATNVPGVLQVPASGSPQTLTITVAISDEMGRAPRHRFRRESGRSASE